MHKYKYKYAEQDETISAALGNADKHASLIVSIVLKKKHCILPHSFND